MPQACDCETCLFVITQPLFPLLSGGWGALNLRLCKTLCKIVTHSYRVIANRPPEK